MKYDYKSVLAILQSQGLDWSGKEEQAKQLCTMACLRTAGRGTVLEVEDDEMEMSNGMVEMPESCVRVTRVRTATSPRPRWKYIDGTVQMLDLLSGKVLVDWWQIPLDDNLLPSISQHQLDYCAAACELYYMRLKWLEQKINNSQFAYFEQKERDAYKRATKHRPTIDEMEKAAWMMRNGMFYTNFDILKQ